MKKALRKIQFLQCFLTLSISVVVVLSPFRDSWRSVAAGAGIALVSTLTIGLILRRRPMVIKNKDFLRLMIICEGAKWLMTAVTTAWFLHYFSALGLVTGFAVTYLGSYAGCFLIK